MTINNEEKPELDIKNVFHWPRSFRKGDRVVTSFKVENKGHVSARKLKVILLVNDKQKNKVEDINIPVSGFADIKLPWIAEKGKNDIRILVR